MFTSVLILLCAAAVFDSFHKLFYSFVTQRGQIGWDVFSKKPYLGSWHQREHVLHVRHVLRPELIPKVVIFGANGLQDIRTINMNVPDIKRHVYLSFGRKLDNSFPEHQFSVGVTHLDSFASGTTKFVSSYEIDRY